MGISGAIAGAETKAAVDEEIKQRIVVVGHKAAAKSHGVLAVRPGEGIGIAEGIVNQGRGTLDAVSNCESGPQRKPGRASRIVRSDLDA